MDNRNQAAGPWAVANCDDPPDTVTRDTLEVDVPSDARASRVHALHVLDGSQAGLIFVLEQAEVVVGRDEACRLSLGDPGVSRAHAAFTLSVTGVQVADRGSRNGTFVNGQRIGAATPLRQGDTITVGGVRLRYGIEAEDQVSRYRALYHAAVRDHLTGLYNRRFFEERLLAEVAYAVRHRSPVSLLMFDVDRFKQLNDTYGHVAGDVALKAVASVLAGGVRTEDMVARFGGEEFVIVARGSGIEGALALAERLRARVQALSLEHEGHTLGLTMSAGAASLSERITTARQLLRAADGALFDAKAQGRNRVVAGAVEGPIARTGEIDAVRPSSARTLDGDESA